MEAVVIRDSELHYESRDDPVPGDTELLVAVHAAGLNGADMIQRREHSIGRLRALAHALALRQIEQHRAQIRLLARQRDAALEIRRVLLLGQDLRHLARGAALGKHVDGSTGHIAIADRIGALEQELARIRAADLLVDTATYPTMLQRLEPSTAPQATFRHTARELLALSAWHANDTTAARKWLDLIANDAETPPGLRSRAEALQALLPPVAKS